MHQDTPATIGLRQRLQNTGQTLNLSQNDMMRLYFLDGFFRRLVVSAYHHQFVLGGALFLFKVALGPRQARLTQDSDFSIQGLPHDKNTMQQIVQSIASIVVADELQFDASSVLAAPIMGGNPLLGLQVRLIGYLGKARDTITLDCSFGPVFPPGPQLRDLPPTLPTQAPIPVWTIPLEDVMAGKVEGMLRRGVANTRYKDYWDIARLAETQDFSGDLLEATLGDTCTYYNTPFTAQAAVFSSSAFGTDPVQLANWQRFLMQLRGMSLATPTFNEVLSNVRALYSPVLQGVVRGKVWSHQSQQWT